MKMCTTINALFSLLPIHTCAEYFWQKQDFSDEEGKQTLSQILDATQTLINSVNDKLFHLEAEKRRTLTCESGELQITSQRVIIEVNESRTDVWRDQMCAWHSQSRVCGFLCGCCVCEYVIGCL